MSMLMLSVSGCRGIVGETLSPEVAARFAGCFAAVLRESARGKRVRVVLGRDGRRGGEMIHAAAASGLLAGGCDVVDIGVAMTPTVAVNTDHTAREGGDEIAAAGMVVTASHNPQQWNGLKCLLRDPVGLHGAGAAAPPQGIANKVIGLFREGRALGCGWNEVGVLSRREDAASTVHIRRVMEGYRAAGLTDKPEGIGLGIKVAVDCVNASASATAPAFLRAIGCEVVEVNTKRTGVEAGIFPHPPEPTAENLGGAGGLCDIVRERGCAVGFALDTDADRLALIDASGKYVGEEYTLALSAWAVLEAMKERAKGAVLVTNLSTSRMLDDAAAKYGARVLRTPVGEANVVETMKREGSVVGGEGNGGTIWPASCYVRDSLVGMGLVAWLLNAGVGGKRSLAALCGSIPAYAIEKRKVELRSKEDAAAVVAKIADAYAMQRVDLCDGAWVDFVKGPLAGKAWLHVRASNTEPIMRLIAEAPSVEEARGVLDEAARVIVA